MRFNSPFYLGYTMKTIAAVVLVLTIRHLRQAADADVKNHLVSEVGHNATLCFSSCDGNLSLTFSSTQDEKLKVLDCSQRNCTAGDFFKNRVNVDWNSSGKFCLNLFSIKYNDDGWFESTCDSKLESFTLEVVSTTSHVDALFKSNISIPCYSRTSKKGSHDKVNIYWYKDGEKVLYVEKGKITYGEGYENRASVVLDHHKDGSLSLTLRSITTSDQGKYLCHTTAGKSLAHFENWPKKLGEDLEMDLFDSDDMYVTFTAASTKIETHVCNVNRGKPSCSPAYTKRVSVINNTLVLKSLSSKDAGNFTIKDNKDEVISVHKVSVTEGGNLSWILGVVLGALKLRLINGLNGGLVTGINGVNPLLVGGLNPPVLPGGGAVLGQPQIPQFYPAAALPPYLLQQPPVPAVPFGLPNPVPQMPFPIAPANGGLPYFIGGAQNPPVVISPQQQVAPGQGPAANNQGVLPQGTLTRFKMPTQLSPTVSGNTVG
ncbi:hypothetical protein DNTS_013984 [Danionella cerebrum]|uniref:Ig-like domain-containing protein n=1 Tax=Danionella cerebrum TaxID=2873325 RepID=A0A553NIW1_9TELE|nr:hypothetical protein DNTS_013984 [Danionella translucida]